MAHPRLSEGKCEKFIVGEGDGAKHYLFQELPYMPVIELVGEATDIIDALIRAAQEKGDLTALQWRVPVMAGGEPVMVPVLDAEGEPVVDEGSGSTEMCVKTEFNFDLIMALLTTAVRQIKNKGDFMARLVDAAVVAEGKGAKKEDRHEEFLNVTAGTMLRAIMTVMRLSLGEGSTLGNELAAVFADKKVGVQKEQETQSSTGSSASTTPPPTSSAPQQPQLALVGDPAVAPPSVAESQAKLPSSGPVTPPTM